MAEAVRATPGLRLAGVMTHFATADDDPVFMAEQLARFLPWADAQGAHAPRRQLRRGARATRRRGWT